ncbi:MAG: class II aldolase/adducin family protein [Nitrososphaerota archaeon]|nr:class II aldolase/adducin family protein [Nitrososphaerales archaeon]MDW8044860.1 class II aldolase/adducin family protein [Nitrososphaerota archaeon]
MRNTQKLLRDLCRRMKRLAEKGWFPGSSGNFSIFIKEEGLIYIKRTGSRISDIDLDDLVALNLEGSKVRGTGIPSKEYRFHLGIYKLRDELCAIIHGHPPYSTALALANCEMPMVTGPAKAYLKKVPLVEYAPSGSEELAHYVIEAFKDRDVKAALLKDHGVVCVGQSLDDLLNVAEFLEDNARVFLTLSLINRLLKG